MLCLSNEYSSSILLFNVYKMEVGMTMNKVAGLVRRCVEDYDMISDGETIAVCVSGREGFHRAAVRDEKPECLLSQAI